MHSLPDGRADEGGVRQSVVGSVALLEVASSSAIIREGEGPFRALFLPLKVEATMGGSRIKAHCPRASLPPEQSGAESLILILVDVPFTRP